MSIKKQKKKLPKYVITDGDEWYVRRYFPTGQRYANGSPIYIQVKRICFPATVEQAEYIANEIESQMRAPTNISTLSEFLAVYIESKRHSVSLKTVEMTEDYFKRYVGALGAAPLAEINALMLQRHYAALNRSPSVIHKFHKCLSTAFNQAVKWDTLPKNPCRGVLLPKTHKKDIVAFDQEQARAFLDLCTDPKHLILHFLLETGLRPGEAIALEWTDIDLKRCTVTVSKSIARGYRGGGFVVKDPKTKSSRRTLEFSHELRDRLFALKRTSKLVFPSEAGTPLSVANINNRLFKPIAETIGVPCSIYSLRHTSITLLLAAGADIKAVSQRAGHSDITVTLNFYSHIIPSMRREVGEKLNAVLYA